MQSFEGDVQTPVAAILFIIQSLFILSYFGQRLSSNVLSQSVSIYHSMWYRYPLKVQRYLPMIFMRAQRTFAISGYGIFELSLYFFLRVNTSRLSLSLKCFHRKNFKGPQVVSVGIYGAAKRRRDMKRFAQYVYVFTQFLQHLSSLLVGSSKAGSREDHFK